MAAPESSSLWNMEGRWIFHKGLSDSTDALLTLQGQAWWKRQAAGIVTVIEHIKQSKTPSDVLRYDIELRISGGFKGGAEWLLDGSEESMNHVNLGRIKSASIWSDLSELDDAWLKDDWLIERSSGPDGLKHIKASVTSEKGGWHLTNVWGFVNLEGKRYHARKLLVRRRDKVARCRAH
ncbi:hypothetical protein P153DRAFT_382091 [Dothidotthia symphoricarpi CBS 119687]|uniref:Uncharacterized protein n=1 Tax=Dothidotthia symphoricarpi CBS 119687 TaxID=1392245 RepID=A0A6A6AN31_9PLEO|nr:uncharacterized protein P153DRAFT_382091 [Dothidotthia symphoricarpi CBS 119687]KAF2132465.1 hypothetical protein P153DRAFT_382091 [Dothidotthia symphoricarpi CBS 119687]